MVTQVTAAQSEATLRMTGQLITYCMEFSKRSDTHSEESELNPESYESLQGSRGFRPLESGRASRVEAEPFPPSRPQPRTQDIEKPVDADATLNKSSENMTVDELDRRVRESADQIATDLVEVSAKLQPDEAVDSGRVAVLEEHLALLQRRLEIIAVKGAQQDALVQKLHQDVTALSSDLAMLSQGDDRRVTRTPFESIARGVLFATVGAMISGGLGGPTIAYLMNEPVSGHILEGVIDGALGGVAAEVATRVENSDQAESSAFAHSLSREALPHERRRSLGEELSRADDCPLQEWSPADEGPAQGWDRAR